MKNEPTNKPTAKLRILMLKFVVKYDYYPNDWFDLNDMEQQFLNDEIKYEEYDLYVSNLLENWKKNK